MQATFILYNNSISCTYFLSPLCQLYTWALLASPLYVRVLLSSSWPAHCPSLHKFVFTGHVHCTNLHQVVQECVYFNRKPVVLLLNFLIQSSTLFETGSDTNSVSPMITGHVFGNCSITNTLQVLREVHYLQLVPKFRYLIKLIASDIIIYQFIMCHHNLNCPEGYLKVVEADDYWEALF